MYKLIIGIVNVCFFFVVIQGLITQTKLDNVEEYVEDVLQMLMHDLEDKGFCNLLMNDLNSTVNETVYGKKVVGNLRYFNGFVIGADDVYRKPDPVGQALSEKTFEASVSIKIIFKGLSYAYDLEAELMDEIQRATGIFKTSEVVYQIFISKNLKTKVFTSSCEMMSIGSNGRMDFQPKNFYTTIIARTFNGKSDVIKENFGKFGAGLLGDLLQKIVAEKINFPDVNFDTNAK